MNEIPRITSKGHPRHAEGREDEVRRALIEYLYAIGDDELILGHRASEWTGLGPILEADIALSSIAQDEMGHALAYYRLLEALGEGDPDEIGFGREMTAFRNAIFSELPRGDWGFTVIRHYLHDVNEKVRLQALADSSYEPLAQTARKLITEEKYHLIHGQSWVSKLAQATEESHRRLQAGLDRAFPYALGLFEAVAELESVRVEAGIAPPAHELQEQWLDEIVPFLQDAGLTVPAEKTENGWEVFVEPVYGGRRGDALARTEYMEAILSAMQLVVNTEPDAEW